MAAANQFHQLFRDVPAAAAQQLFLLFGPASVGDRLTGEVDDGVKAIKILLVGPLDTEAEAEDEAVTVLPLDTEAEVEDEAESSPPSGYRGRGGG